jgi:hypothetical protein
VTLTPGEEATFIVNDYLVTASCEGLGKPYIEPGCLQYTGTLQVLTPPYLAKLMIGDEWVMFDLDDATQLTGPVN